MKMKRMLQGLFLFACAMLLLSSPAWAIFTNGGFEAGNFSGWTTGFGLDPSTGLTGSPPFTGASIVINPGGAQLLAIVGNIQDPRTDNTLVLPRAGNFTAKVNDEIGGNNINWISQQAVVDGSFLDPSDNQLHVRFNYAPVLENPQHAPAEQPFFYVRLKNVTKNTVLFEDFAYSGQAGKNFVNSTMSPGWQYTNWLPVDIVIPNADLGDTVEIYTLASDCSLGGHGGYVYLDGFGATILPPTGQLPQNINVPTMTEWGMIAFVLLAGLGSVLFLRRQRRA